MKYCWIFLVFSLSSFAQENNLLVHLKNLSSDEMEGREFGEYGNQLAQEYIIDQFKALTLQPAFNASYVESFIHDNKVGKNIAAIIPGQSERTIVITAHYDHLGVVKGKIYNGADDNASGTAALFEIARRLSSRDNKHTFIIAAVDAEEQGCIGSQYLIDHFPLPLQHVALNVNLDMIAHNDNSELYACGTYHYPQLKAPLANIESTIELKYGHDGPSYKDDENWTFASDHMVFHKKKIPFIYFGVDNHPDYHQPSDSYETINKSFYLEAVELIIKAIEAYDSGL